MADQKSIRINDSDDPDRADKFSKALKRSAANGNKVVRELIDAYNRFVDKHGRSPNFPVDLQEPKPRAGK